MDKKRAKEILMAHSCCSFTNKENNLCMLCPWNDTKDCQFTTIDEETIVEAMKTLEGVTDMERIKLSEIKITSAFTSTIPKPHKMQKYRDYYIEYKGQSKPIIVDKNNYLQDGYIQYLILKENGVEETIVIRRKNNRRTKIKRNKTKKLPVYKTNRTTYIYGVHPSDISKKERVWRVPNTWLGWENDLLPGDVVKVRTRYGIRLVIVTKIEWLDKPPVDYPVKRVVEKCKMEN